jgi:hypothetical protein
LNPIFGFGGLVCTNFTNSLGFCSVCFSSYSYNASTAMNSYLKSPYTMIKVYETLKISYNENTLIPPEVGQLQIHKVQAQVVVLALMYFDMEVTRYYNLSFPKAEQNCSIMESIPITEHYCSLFGNIFPITEQFYSVFGNVFP